jgi:uncharacterized protein YbbC (DUF1343 family)
MSSPTRSWLRRPKVRLGIDILLESRRDLLHDKRVGVITNQTGLTWDLTHYRSVYGG